MMIWQLLQVRQMKESPLILVGKMWEGLVEWTRDQLLWTQPPLISPEDVNIPQCVRSADDAIALLKKHHAQWMRENGRAKTRGA
jgi:predicted Rossmann-fold nucleotide-binding protein